MALVPYPPLVFSTRRGASITPSHAQTALSAHSRSSTPDRTLASHRQRSGSKQSTTITPCPALRAHSSELRAGRRRFDGRCFRCSKTGCALHTGHADYDEGEHWHIGLGRRLAAGFMANRRSDDESLPLTGVHSADSTCRQSTHVFQGRTFTGAALRRRYPCQPRGRRAAPK